MKTRIYTLAHFTLIVYSMTIFASSFAFADTATPTPAASPTLSCDAFCAPLVNGDGKVLGLTGSTGWTTADDQWCANNGVQTNTSVMYNASAVTPTASNSAQSQTWLARCGWHNGQAEQQCQAYEGAQDGLPREQAVLYLDIAAAGSCTVACAAKVMPATLAACRIAGTSASGVELIETLLQKSDPVSKALSGAMSVYGLYSTISAAKADGFENYFSGKTQPAEVGSGPNPAKGTANAQQQADTKAKHDSCMAAIMYALMSAARYSALSSQKSTEQNACSAIQQLQSTASTVAASGAAALGSGAGTGGSGTGTASAGSTGATNAGGNSSLRCVGNNGSVSSCTGTSGPDTTALQASGMGAQVAPVAQQLANSPIGQALAQGKGDLGQAIQAAGGGAAGDAGNAVTTVASAAQAHPEALSEGVTGTSMTGGGGGGGGGEGEGEAPNPLGALAALLNPQKDQASAGGGATRFPGSREPSDIWHKNTDQNLFQIISGRIEKASSRLQ